MNDMGTLNASFIMIKKAIEVQVYIFVALNTQDPLIVRNYDTNLMLMLHSLDFDDKDRTSKVVFDVSKIFWSFFKFNSI